MPKSSFRRCGERPRDSPLGIPESLVSAMDALPKVRFASDSPLEGGGFEPLVPRNFGSPSIPVGAQFHQLLRPRNGQRAHDVLRQLPAGCRSNGGTWPRVDRPILIETDRFISSVNQWRRWA